MRDEIADLRAQLDEAQVLIEFRDYRSRALSKMLNLGIWEWDEKTDSPLSYSDELADVYGVKPKELDRLLKNREGFDRIVHPDDLEAFKSNLDSHSILQPDLCHSFDFRVINKGGDIRYLRVFEQPSTEV